MTEVLDTVPAAVVLESSTLCADRDRARAALNDALLGARAPTHGGQRPHGPRPTGAEGTPWTLTMTVTRGEGGGRSVGATIADDAGKVVAERTLSDRGVGGCLPLARAVGAWASLVLDAEMNRATDSTPEPMGVPLSTSSSAPIGGDGDPGARPPSGPDVVTPDPAAAPPKNLELGTMMYIRNGLTPTGGMAGLSPFVTIEVAKSWVLRPALYFGRSTDAFSGGDDSAPKVSHLGARADFCRRIPGNYTDRRGIEADLCAGLEGGVVTNTSRPGRLGTGPSFDIRGELGAGVALELRGLVGANLLPFANGDQMPLVFASAEVGVSVRLR